MIYQQPNLPRYVPQGGAAPQWSATPAHRGGAGTGQRYLPAMPEMLEGTAANPATVPVRPAPQPAPRYAQQRTVPPRKGGTYLPAMPEMMQVQSQEYRLSDRGMTVRGARPEERPEQRLTAQLLEMPAPEKLGLSQLEKRTPQSAPTMDWQTMRTRLEALGATQYRLEKVDRGQFRFTCALPDPRQPSQSKEFSLTAATESEVMSHTLQSIQTWLDAQR